MGMAVSDASAAKPTDEAQRTGTPKAPVAGRPASTAQSAQIGIAARGKVAYRERGDSESLWRREMSGSAQASASQILRKLGAPEFKVEDAQEEKLRIKREPCGGAGYDPYNQAKKPRRK